MARLIVTTFCCLLGCTTGRGEVRQAPEARQITRQDFADYCRGEHAKPVANFLAYLARGTGNPEEEVAELRSCEQLASGSVEIPTEYFFDKPVDLEPLRYFSPRSLTLAIGAPDDYPDVPVHGIEKLSTLEDLSIAIYNKKPLTPLFIKSDSPVELSKLTRLSIEYIGLGAQGFDFSFVGKIPSLQTLSINYFNILNLSSLGLDRLEQLQILDLSGNWIVDASPLAAVTGLTELNLASNSIYDLYFVDKLPRLRTLDVTENLFESLDGIARTTVARIDIRTSLEGAVARDPRQAKKQEAARAALQGLHDRVFVALQSSDFDTLATFIHPTLGLSVQPLIECGKKYQRDTFAERLYSGETCPFQDPVTGEPAQAMTHRELFERQIYDRRLERVPAMVLHEPFSGQSEYLRTSAIEDGGLYVAYFHRGDWRAYGWKLLIMLFKPHDGAYYLTGLGLQTWEP